MNLTISSSENLKSVALYGTDKEVFTISNDKITNVLTWTERITTQSPNVEERIIEAHLSHENDNLKNAKCNATLKIKVADECTFNDEVSISACYPNVMIDAPSSSSYLYLIHIYKGDNRVGSVIPLNGTTANYTITEPGQYGFQIIAIGDIPISGFCEASYTYLNITNEEVTLDIRSGESLAGKDFFDSVACGEIDEDECYTLITLNENCEQDENSQEYDINPQNQSENINLSNDVTCVALVGGDGSSQIIRLHEYTYAYDSLLAILDCAFPKTNESRREEVAKALFDYHEQFEINTDLRLAHFIGQIGWETDNLNKLKENCNYSAAAIVKTFGFSYRGHLFEGYNSDLTKCTGNPTDSPTCTVGRPTATSPLFPYKSQSEVLDAFNKGILKIIAEYIDSCNLFDFVYSCRLCNGPAALENGSAFAGVV